MRNLKRVLSLALALVMMLSLMIVGSSAAEAKKVNFTDANEIAYTEAVDVMTALGVIQGTDKGAFNPQGTLTREAAAKIVCYMLLGPENAEKLTTNTQIFTDVAAGRWSAGYIAYCTNLNILAGTGDGSFNPEGQLTGVAFGKMLLIALGYDPAIQGYVGANWSTAIATDMLDAGIDVQGTTLSDPLTREQAAQMAFQTLEADMVRYANKGTTVNTSDGTSVIVGASEPTAVAAVGDQNYNNADTDSHDEVYQQFCEKYFPKLSKDNLPSGDELGRPGYEWNFNGDQIGTFAEGAKYTLKDEFTAKDLYNTIGKTAANYAVGKWTVKVDGVDGTSSYLAATVRAQTLAKNDDAKYAGNGAVTEIFVDGTSSYLAATVCAQTLAKNDDAKYAGNGAVTEIFVDTDAEEVTVCIINTYAAEIDKVYTEDDVKDDEKPYVELTDADDGTLSFETVAFEEDDVVIYTKGIDEDDNPVIVTMALAEEVEGEVTKVTTGKNFTVDGTTYKYNCTLDPNDKIVAANVGKDARFYVDANGYMVFKGEAKTSNDFAYVIAAGYENDRYNDGAFTYYAKLLLTDGTIEAVQLKKGSWADADLDGSAASDTYAEKIVTYTVSNGKYELTVAANGTPALSGNITNNAYLSIRKGVASMLLNNTAASANNNTVFLVCNDKDDEDYSVYVGYKNVPDIAGLGGTSKVAWAKKAATGAATVVYIEDASVETGSSDDVIFIVGKADPDEVKTNDGTYCVYKAVVDGKSTEINVLKSSTADGALKAADGEIIVAKSLSYDSKNFVTKYTAYATYSGGDGWKAAADVGTKKVSDGVVGFGGETFGYSDDALIVKKDGSKITTGGISSVKNDDNDEAILVLKDDEIIAAFITVRASDYVPPVVSHVHELTWSGQQAAQAATCNAKGHVAYYTVTCANSDGQCTLTGTEKYASTNGNSTTDPGTALTDAEYETDIDPTNHDYAAGWTADGSKHWHVCNNGCGTKGTEGAHVGEPSDGSAIASTGNQAGVTHTWTCTTCNETATGSCTHPSDGVCPACGAAKP